MDGQGEPILLDIPHVRFTKLFAMDKYSVKGTLFVEDEVREELMQLQAKMLADLRERCDFHINTVKEVTWKEHYVDVKLPRDMDAAQVNSSIERGGHALFKVTDWMRKNDKDDGVSVGLTVTLVSVE